MDKDGIVNIILGILRHSLTTGGGALVAQGYLSSGDLNTSVGAVMTLIGIAWSIYEKVSTKKKEVK